MMTPHRICRRLTRYQTILTSHAHENGLMMTHHLVDCPCLEGRNRCRYPKMIPSLRRLRPRQRQVPVQSSMISGSHHGPPAETESDVQTEGMTECEAGMLRGENRGHDFLPMWCSPATPMMKLTARSRADTRERNCRKDSAAGTTALRSPPGLASIHSSRFPAKEQRHSQLPVRKKEGPAQR